MFVNIDPNVRIYENLTFSGFEDVINGNARDLNRGQLVDVKVPETDITGTAKVQDVDRENRIVYLDVAWNTLRRGSVWADID